AWLRSGAPAPGRRTIALAAALAAALGCLGAVLLAPGKKPPPRAVARFDYPLPDAHELRHITSPLLAVAPHGRAFAHYTTRRASPPTPTRGRYLRSRAAPGPRLVPGTEEDLRAPFFSPDGGWIGYFAGGELKKIPAGGGTPIVLCRTGPPYGASWERDGTIVY